MTSMTRDCVALFPCTRRRVLQVTLPIVRQFVKKVEEKALGVKVIKGVKPDQMLVRVVNDELVELMGGKKEDLADPDNGPQVLCSLVIWASHTFTSFLSADEKGDDATFLFNIRPFHQREWDLIELKSWRSQTIEA